ncbi:MAG TPA: hypothetical protein VIL49_00790 [Capillimicrobium sp.]
MRLVVALVALLSFAAGAWAVAGPPHSEVGKVAAWMDDALTCASVEHREVELPVGAAGPGIAPAVSDRAERFDIVACQKLGGQVDVLRFGSPGELEAVLREEGARRRVCVHDDTLLLVNVFERGALRAACERVGGTLRDA